MSRLRRPSPALLVSVLALVMASLGGASAAVHLISGTQIKRNSIPGNRLRANGVTGREVKESSLGRVPLAAHANDATSATHATTADSATHATTAGNATHASSADSAPLPGHLGSGQSLRGAWALGAVPTGQIPETGLSFPIPVDGTITSHIIDNTAGTATPPSGCSGTAAAPVAGAGNLCIWVEGADSMGSFYIYNPLTGIGDPGMGNDVSRLGTVLRGIASGNNADAFGTWVVTAP